MKETTIVSAAAATAEPAAKQALDGAVKKRDGDTSWESDWTCSWLDPFFKQSIGFQCCSIEVDQEDEKPDSKSKELLVGTAAKKALQSESQWWDTLSKKLTENVHTTCNACTVVYPEPLTPGKSGAAGQNTEI